MAGETDVRAEMAAEIFSDDPVVETREEPAEAHEPAEEQKADDKQAAPAGDDAKAEAPWERGMTDLNAKLDRIVSSIEQVSNRVKPLEGRVGSIANALFNKAASETKQAGGDAPTKQQIEEAKKDDESWAALKEDFPEWADAIDKRWAKESAKIAKAQESFLSKQDAQQVILASQNEVRRQIAEEVEKRIVSIRHPGYEQTLKTREFWNWFNTQPAEMKAKAKSIKAEDAIAVLDAYKQKTAEAGKPPITEERKKRLARAAHTPGGVTQPPIKSESDMTPKELRAHLSKQIWGG